MTESPSVPRTKQQIIDEIYGHLARPSPTVSRGSTEPKQVFLDVIRVCRLNIATRLSKPELGEAITAAAGLPWTQDCDSRHAPSGGGSTVTAIGLERVLQSTQVLLGSSVSTTRRPAAFTGTQYRVSVRAPSVRTAGAREPDLDALDRASQGHLALQNAIAQRLNHLGSTPLSPESGDPQFDIAWRSRGSLYVCEVKTLGAGLRQQIRLGMGQVSEYRTVLRERGEARVQAVLAVDCPTDPLTDRVAAALDIRLIHAPTLEDEVGQLL